MKRTVKEKLLDKEVMFKALDRLKDLVDISIYAGLAYLGAKHFKHPVGALFGPVALKLAQSNNIVAGTSGVIGLTALGVAVSGVDIELPDMDSWDDFVKKERERTEKHPFGATRVGW